jgi:uncharacterized protein HemX
MYAKCKKELNKLNNSKDKMTRSEKATKKASNAKRKKLFLIIGTVALAVCLLLGLGGFVFYNHLMEDIRAHLDAGTFEEFYQQLAPRLDRRI